VKNEEEGHLLGVSGKKKLESVYLFLSIKFVGLVPA
jgi:hypothetical protein